MATPAMHTNDVNLTKHPQGKQGLNIRRAKYGVVGRRLDVKPQRNWWVTA